MTRKTTQLKNILQGDKIEFILEAHNGLSAKIVEETGFCGIWGSGLTISASLGVRDNNEVSWTQVLEVVEFMSDCTLIPILLDGDTGFGNFNNVRRLVKKLEQIGVAGVCIEDKIFPKTNSFIGGEQQPLADIEEFCGRIKAGKDTQKDSDFCIVARVEAFIAGWGLEEALKRARSYTEAGADAILIHSKLSNPKDIFDFLKRWGNNIPIVIVPTMYYETSIEEFEKTKVSLVVWANHMLRSSVAAMRKTGRQIFEERSLKNIEKTVAPVDEIFQLQDVKEYKEAEKKYLPQTQNIKAIILAASKGENFGDLTDERPKCMLEVFGKSILSSQVETMNSCNIKNISIVVGYKKEAVDFPNLKHIDNPEYENGSILLSYFKAKDNLEGPCIISFGDILFKDYVLQDLIDVSGDIVLAIDTSWWQGKRKDREIDCVIGEMIPSDNYLHDRCTVIKSIGTHINLDDAHGEWIGLMKLSSHGAVIFRSELEQFFEKDREAFSRTGINEFLVRIIEKGIEIKALYCRGHWLDIDSLEDLSLVQKI